MKTMFARRLLLAATLAWACAVAAQTSAPAPAAHPAPAPRVSQAPDPAAALLPAEAFFRRPSVKDIALSPSGRRLAFTAEVRGRTGLFTIHLQSGDFKPTPAVLFNDADVRRFSWVDDERLVFDVVDLQAGSGEDYRVAPGLFVVGQDGADLRQLIERRGRPLITSGGRPVRTLTWNHSLLHVPAPAEDRAGAPVDEVLVGERRFDGNGLHSVTPLWLNIRTGRTRSADIEGTPDRAVRWWFAPQGEPRAVLRSALGRDSLHWLQAGKDGAPARWVQLSEGPMAALPWTPVWVGRGDQLYVTRTEGPGGELVVAPFDFAKGAPGDTLIKVPGFDFSGQLLGSVDGNTLLGVRVDADAEQTVWFEPGRKALQAQVDAALPGRVNRISCRRCGEPDAVVLVRSWSDRHPGQLLLWQSEPGGAGRWQAVASVMPGIAPQRMATLSFERIRARDGRDLPLWVTLPADYQPGQPRPAVVLVHGGPWVRGGHWRWDPMAQFLASRGWVVIEPEYRGSAGYGRAHMAAGFKQYGQAMQDDVADALLWAQSKKIASDKACIAGGSYGGYATLMGLVRHPQLYRCGSAWYALADLPLYVEGGWFVMDDISGAGRRYVLPERVGHPEHDRAMLLAQSPVTQAAHLKAPLQLVWGADDLRVPLAHGKRLRSAMQAAGLEPEWIEYPGEGHGLRQIDNQVDMAKKLEAFLARHLN